MINAVLLEDSMELTGDEKLICPVILANINIKKTFEEKDKAMKKEMLEYETYNKMHIIDGTNNKCPSKL